MTRADKESCEAPIFKWRNERSQGCRSEKGMKLMNGVLAELSATTVQVVAVKTRKAWCTTEAQSAHVRYFATQPHMLHKSAQWEMRERDNFSKRGVRFRTAKSAD